MTRGRWSPTSRRTPLDALLLSTAVPTIAFAGVTEVPEEAWAIVERAIPAYGDDWWFTGLLAFVRQEQGRFDEAMALACRSLAVEPGAGHSAHARAHAHYETGDHHAGLAWMDGWVTGDGAVHRQPQPLRVARRAARAVAGRPRRRPPAVRRPAPPRARARLPGAGRHRLAAVPLGAHPRRHRRPRAGAGGRAGRPRRARAPGDAVPRHAQRGHAAGAGRRASPRPAGSWAAAHDHPTQREVVAPLARALGRLAAGRHSEAADALAALAGPSRRLGGSDAQREIIEETRIAALVRADRLDEARDLLDARLDRRHSPRDARWLRQADRVA